MCGRRMHWGYNLIENQNSSLPEGRQNIKEYTLTTTKRDSYARKGKGNNSAYNLNVTYHNEVSVHPHAFSLAVDDTSLGQLHERA